tara:strand:- start:42 stop:599 length:558 start_codon:yes stop_codon:yes gene_type:complete
MENSASFMPFSGSYKAASFGDAFQKLLNSETLKNSLSHGGPAENLLNFATGSPLVFSDEKGTATLMPGNLNIQGKNLNFGINAPSRRLDVGYTNNKGNFNVNAYAGLGSKFMPDTNVGVNFRFGTPGYAPLVPDQITIEENVIAPFSRMLNEKQNVENTISPARAYAEDQTKLYMQNNPYYYRSR